MVTLFLVSFFSLAVYYFLSSQRSAAKARTRKLQTW